VSDNHDHRKKDSDSLPDLPPNSPYHTLLLVLFVSLGGKHAVEELEVPQTLWPSR